MVEQLGCPVLLHWQATFNLNHRQRNPANSHLVQVLYNSAQNRAEIFLPVSLPQTSCCPLSCSVLLSPHPVSHVCTRECFKAVLSFLRNLLCMHKLWRVFFSCYYLAKSNPFSTWILKCRSPPFQTEASKALRH